MTRTTTPSLPPLRAAIASTALLPTLPLPVSPRSTLTGTLSPAHVLPSTCATLVLVARSMESSRTHRWAFVATGTKATTCTRSPRCSNARRSSR
ncbi:hypothetical protein BDV98DRAFT_565102 [Pterulicium gracile]|uniref:Uncharacterized protein n=1 Tax=Pterulicium gracile TaxID=1884261 RepID=A0A5C3QX51_9AGAR|nr:hypothetical protein BDV98DRAFT_565102 [Pterula gracilis]